MKRLVILIFMIIALDSYSQSITIYGGWHKNELFPEGFIGTKLNNVVLRGAEGYSFQVNYRPTASKQSLSLLIDHYNGEIEPNGVYINDDTPDVIFIEKTTLGLGLYPFDIKTIGNLHIQPGADISVLINDKTRFGYFNTFSGTGKPDMTFMDDTLRINNNFQFGVCAIVRYQINIANYFIAPSYKIYVGGRSELSSNAELVYDAKSIYSLRHTFSVGIGRKLKRTSIDREIDK
jgi:hypothetical protein